MTNRYISEDQTTNYAAHNQGSKRLKPVPGEYFLQLPPVIAVKEINVTGQVAVEFELNGTTITRAKDGDETFRGSELHRFLAANTLSRKAKEGGAFSDLVDLLKTFGIDVNTLNELSDFEQAAQQIAGQETPIPIYITYQGSYKGPNGKKRYLKERDFKRADGTFANGTYVVDMAAGITMIDPPVPDEIAVNEQAKRDYLKQYPFIFANLVPGFRGWATPEAS